MACSLNAFLICKVESVTSVAAKSVPVSAMREIGWAGICLRCESIQNEIGARRGDDYPTPYACFVHYVVVAQYRTDTCQNPQKVGIMDPKDPGSWRILDPVFLFFR